MSSSVIEPDGKIYCTHREEAAKRKSSTLKHVNRDFYCCKRSMRDPTRCKFFLWADEIQAQDQKSTEGEPSSRTHPTPLTDTPLESPQRRKRLGDINTGLKQRDQDHSPSPVHRLRSNEPEPSIPFNPGHEIPQPPSPVPTEVDGETEVKPKKTFSFLGLYNSPDTTTTALGVEGQPSTPKEQQQAALTEDTAVQLDAGPSGSRLILLTPPQTTQHFSRKGKEREVWPSVEIQAQDGSAQYNARQIGNSGEPPEDDSLPLFTLPDDTFTVATSASPTPAENVLDYADGIKARVKALQEYMDSFDIIREAKSLQTVERQRMRYEYRDRSQKKRIEELVAKVSRLEEELKRCEDGIKLKDAEIAALRGGRD